MDSITLLQKLSGIQTIESVMDALKTNKGKAVYYIHRLRKQGYIKTKRLSNNKRVYKISIENKLGGKSYYDIINEHSPIKIATPIMYKIYGKEPALEETLVYAIKTRSLRTILASLALFRKINNWSLLYALAKADRNNEDIRQMLKKTAKDTQDRDKWTLERFFYLQRGIYKFTVHHELGPTREDLEFRVD